eukprot:TRINITY_DN41175_c0_g1_i1.p1 TRINITY_DN41175_c0_g1~~TRINITY_DN41175_c0_g1_i1.p1  ORF type:complete len:220 (+),score=42.14 TRINITY_DN41175_c0_g1_i1:3-662(+)
MHLLHLPMSTKAAQPIYELRTYNLVPKEVGNFMALSKKKFHLRTGHSVLLGYWTTELGGLNQVVHLWQYDSYAHRAGVRAKLGGDQEWQVEYFQKILPWLQHQDNLTLDSLIDPVENSTEGGTYEIWQLGIGPNNADWKLSLLELAKTLQGDQTQLCGAFSSVFGPMGSAVLIWRHQDLDSAPRLQDKLFKSSKGQQFLSNVMTRQSKILAPTPFSPWK